MDCNADTLANQQYYRIHDRLWKRINPKLTGMLCLICCETRLGRLLTRRDFTPSLINSVGAEVCPELALRLKRDPPGTNSGSTRRAPTAARGHNGKPSQSRATRKKTSRGRV
jgi:hypothetical protein